MRFSLGRALAQGASPLGVPAIALAMVFAFTACDTTGVPIDRANTDPGLVAGTYVGTAELEDRPASRFTVALEPEASAAPAGTAASSAANLVVSGAILRNGITYAMAGAGEFTYPDVTIAAKSPALGEGEDSFAFELTTDASGTVLAGTVNGAPIQLDKQR